MIHRSNPVSAQASADPYSGGSLAPMLVAGLALTLAGQTDRARHRIPGPLRLRLGGESPIRPVHGSASVSRPERVRGSAQVAIRSNTAGWDITADIASGSVHGNDSMSPKPRCYSAVWLRRFVTSCAVSRDPLAPKRAVT
jgi:hypothetical protein